MLLDDDDARNKAKLYGIQHTGTIGILLRAKKMGKIDSLQTALNKLKNTGFWLNPNLYEKLLK